MQRAFLRAWIAASSLWRSPIAVDGLVMDPAMSSFVRLARRMASEGGGLPALRKRYADAPGVTGLQPDRSVRVAALQAGNLDARRYDPPGPVGATMLYFHGGGFIMGGLGTHDALCRRLAVRGRVRIVSIAYRLAPEHPFPAAHEDAASAWRWAQAELPGPLLVGGDSAGANLAAGIGLTDKPVLQVLIYPAVDLLHQDGRYPSIERFGSGFLLTAEGMRECAAMLIPPGQDAGDPILSPIRGDLSRAAPALVVVAGFDPLRDQGLAFAEALRQAGVPVQLLNEAGLVHGFADFAGVVPEARRAVDRIGDAIRSELEGVAG